MSKKGRSPSQDEVSLWKRFTHGIERLSEAIEAEYEDIKPILPSTDKKASNKKNSEDLKASSPTSLTSASQGGYNGLDKRTRQKLVKGKMPIEARIDLHGMTQDRAKQELTRFVIMAFAAKMRCILVVTGKGSSKIVDQGSVSERVERGVIRKRVPEWVSAPAMQSMVLDYVTAAPKDGGGGAYYIYLRNQNKY